MAHGAVRAGVLVACATGALAIFLGVATAQTERTPTRTAAQAEHDRRGESARAERLREEADAARAEVAFLDTRLVDVGRRRGEAETAQIAAEHQLGELRQRVAEESGRYRRNRNAFETALLAAAFAARRAERGAVRAGMFARAAAPRFRAEMQDAARGLDQAAALNIEVQQAQADLLAAQAAIGAERRQLMVLLDRRRAVQAALAADARAAERRARQLASEVRTLRELAQRLQASSRRRPTAATGGAVLPAAWLAPANGRIVHAFGERVAGGPAAQGAVVGVRPGAQVVAPAPGEIAFSGPFRGYGQVLILNLDGGYALVLTGLETVSLRVGDRVRAGQPVGEMSPLATPAPELYVEVRREGRPIDPARWLGAPGSAG